ncbi:MAG: HNH endonuclease family protein [Ilumatobacteraceae bacterium]
MEHLDHTTHTDSTHTGSTIRRPSHRTVAVLAMAVAVAVLAVGAPVMAARGGGGGGKGGGGGGGGRKTTTTTIVETTTTVTTSVPGLLDGLVVAPEVLDGYSRTLFRHWIDEDRDGCNTRREVLIDESLEPLEVESPCTLVGGRWYSAFDGVVTTDSSTFDVDHMVPLAEAWRSGAHSWTSSRREAFANDLGLDASLIAVTASSNRSKGDGDPAEWLPPLSSYHCQYVIDWVTIKVRWDLTVDQTEYDALADVLADC